ncbi:MULTISPECIES: hypothetical protein [Nitrosospira]|uniref:hypothetical protein n=1 Tax=Nitrosospira TaxID=35798 RepID=UPI000D308457|nr:MULTISPECIES: hypothetical protein [Nitrosospira]
MSIADIAHGGNCYSEAAGKRANLGSVARPTIRFHKPRFGGVFYCAAIYSCLWRADLLIGKQ